MKVLLVFIFSVSCLFTVEAQVFEEFIEYVNNLPESQRQAKIDSLMSATPSFPITEEGIAHFIYNGSGNAPAVPGDFSGWDPVNAPMTNVQGTSFWFRSEEFENEARLDYKIMYNGSTWILDPLNPFTAPGGFGDNSELRMLDYVPPVEIIYQGDIPHGTIESTQFFSTNMNDTRNIKVYLPPGYDQNMDDYPVVLVHDGLEYLSFAKMDNILDYLIEEDLIQPCIAVFVPPVDRTAEYHEEEQADFTNFIVEEVMAWIDEDYRILSSPDSRAVMGSSSGGNISLWLGMTHPEVFGNAGAFSPYIEPDILEGLGLNEAPQMRMYIAHGSYDHLGIIHQSVEAVLPILNEQSYDHIYEEYPEGHSYGFWRAHIDDALIYFFPNATSISEYAGQNFGMEVINSPNPFSERTTISFELLRSADVRIEILDSRGDKIDTLLEERMGAGLNKIEWDSRRDNGDSLESGLYFVCVFVNEVRVECRKILLYR